MEVAMEAMEVRRRRRRRRRRVGWGFHEARRPMRGMTRNIWKSTW
jgi:hypothetical protein